MRSIQLQFNAVTCEIWKREMWETPFEINNTLKVVGTAIVQAEKKVREHLRLYYQDSGEEFITLALYGQMKNCLEQASKNGLIENAFLEDLYTAIQYQHFNDFSLEEKLKNSATGLVADIVLHNKRVEGKTGGDFGLVIIHPTITYDEKYLKIKKGQSSGLLCQAKLKYRDGKWNKIGKNQRALLTQNKNFSSLVLYSYEDKERSIFSPILWTLFKDQSIDNINNLLINNKLEELTLINTEKIIKLLGTKKIGTTDKETINRIISPSARQHFELRIYWPDGKDDLETMKLRVRTYDEEKETVKVHVGLD